MTAARLSCPCGHWIAGTTRLRHAYWALRAHQRGPRCTIPKETHMSDTPVAREFAIPVDADTDMTTAHPSAVQFITEDDAEDLAAEGHPVWMRTVTPWQEIQP